MEADKEAERRIVVAILVGAIISAVSLIPYVKPSDFPDWIVLPVAIVFMPGLYVSTILSGNIHDGGLQAGFAINLVAYSGLIWLLLRWVAQRHSRK